MEKDVHDKWWPLHIRAVRGELLSLAEKEFYEAGLKQLHEEEVLHLDMDALRAARKAAREADAEFQRLVEERNQLKARIAEMEARLPERVREALAVGD